MCCAPTLFSSPMMVSKSATAVSAVAVENPLVRKSLGPPHTKNKEVDANGATLPSVPATWGSIPGKPNAPKVVWVPPPVLRAVAWCVLLGTIAYMLIAGWRVVLYLLAVQNNPAYELTHKWPGSPLLAIAPAGIVICIP